MKSDVVMNKIANPNLAGAPPADQPDSETELSNSLGNTSHVFQGKPCERFEGGLGI